ncbi:hypothetical protein ACN23B_27535 (plasmid) [Anabaena sp. FACHB-709]|uniref:Uncharacterized protein n=1 Tax=Anabaena cylindrica FACHB-318 TaxID=2692880 RepID=A0ABR7ZQB1_ANACY|nr:MULTISPECIES: hypothetical protein [Nostocaceae]MBD2174396.1 hypothetical protein [Anabaena cylindrica FACHB-318]MBD2275577.1 hypothetical protein [Nostoc sp. PCC 7120 = FACHB-418]MBD2286482.1 hypothetical protein [Anabaena cylindrica FACHB-170]MBD2352908.1 hypothetical protein [Trichormus variabilis FACHB-171]BAB78202.1 asl7118 [Nostoc sp. PCC 7120 = FACHB-418]
MAQWSGCDGASIYTLIITCLLTEVNYGDHNKAIAMSMQEYLNWSDECGKLF